MNDFASELARVMGLEGVKLPEQLVTDVGDRLVVESQVFPEIKRRYRSIADLNVRDGCYSAVVMCQHCNPNHEVVKTGWIFDSEEEAIEYAEEMVQEIAKDLVNGILEDRR